MRTVDEWKAGLRVALKDAMRAKQSETVSVLRETLAAIDNAEAAEMTSAPKTQDAVFAGSVAGLGAGEVMRRALQPEDVAAVVEREMADRRTAAAQYRTAGRVEEAEVLERQLAVLSALFVS